LTIFHVLHGHRFIRTSFGDKQIRVTFTATELINMGRVGINYLAYGFILIEYITGSMAFRTVTGHIEGCRAIVTGPAGCTVLHILHRSCFIRTAFRLKEGGMAFAAAELLDVDFMRKYYLTDEFVYKNYLVGMTSDTITLDAESRPAVMAGSAGLAGLHLCHRGVVAVIFLYENIRMADIASGPMNPVIIGNYTNGLCPYLNFVHHFYRRTAPPTATPKTTHTNGMR
jgi:hypothetical protein